MKTIIFYLIFFVPILANAQKVKVDTKTNEVTVDGMHSFNLERTGCGLGMVDCHFDVFDLAGNKVIRVNYHDFKTIIERSPSNPDGTVWYYEFIFLQSKTKAEMEYMGIKTEAMAKAIVKNKLISDGKLDDKAVEEFVLVHGTPFSERMKRQAN